MKYIYTLLLIIIFCLTAKAQVLPDTIYAVTPDNISSKNIKINEKINLLYIKTGTFSSDLSLKEGESINVKIVEYIKPKRGKRDGYYKVELENNTNNKLKGEMRASTPKDMESLAKKAGITITGHILKIPGFSQAAAVTKGLIKPNENENRLQSAGKNLYESTPLCYIEQGKDFEVEIDGIVVLKLK